MIRRGDSCRLVGVKPQHHGNTGGRDLTDLRHYGVHQAGWGQVVDEVEETERALLPPVRQLPVPLRAGVDKILRVQQLVVDEAVRLDSLCELVSLTAEYYRLVAALCQ